MLIMELNLINLLKGIILSLLIIQYRERVSYLKDLYKCVNEREKT